MAPTTQPEIRKVIVDWLDDNFHFGDAAKLIKDDEMSFLDNGVLDSLGFVQIVLHLEDSFHFQIDRKDLSRDNFDGLGKIVRYVMAHPKFGANA